MTEIKEQMKMTIEKKANGNTVELVLSGWMDTQSAPQLAAALEELDPAAESLILDLPALEYTYSAGIRQLVAAHKKMNGAMTLKHVCPEVMDVLRMTGLDGRLHIEP